MCSMCLLERLFFAYIDGEYIVNRKHPVATTTVQLLYYSTLCALLKKFV